MTFFERLSFRTFLVTSAVLSSTTQAFAALGGPIPSVPGSIAPGNGSTATIRSVILKVLLFVLDFLALLAVVFIVIAGIRLIVSQGEEEQKEKAKKTILYVVIGLLVVLFARVVVSFFTNSATGVFTGITG